MRDDTLVKGGVARAGNGEGQVGAAGWSVPGYTGVKALGSGGFGEVVLARHDGSGRQVAIKYLRRDLLADERFAAMFRAEAAVLASVEDPHVVRLHEYVESAGGAAIVMELVDGVLAAADPGAARRDDGGGGAGGAAGLAAGPGRGACARGGAPRLQAG